MIFTGNIIDFHAHGVPKAAGPLVVIAHDMLFNNCVATEFDYAKNASLTDYTIDGPMGLLHSMEETGIGHSVLLPVASKPGSAFETNKSMLAVVNEHRAQLSTFATFHPELTKRAGWFEYLTELKAQGFKGIKVHSLRQKYNPLSDEAKALYAACAQLGLPILMDTYRHKDGMKVPKIFEFDETHRTTPRVIAQILEDFPHLTIVAAHLGGLLQYDEVANHLLGKNLFIDTSFAIFYATDDEVKRILLGHDPHKLLFGTDTPARTQKETIERMLGYKLPDSLYEAIFYANAQRLLNI